MIFWKHLLVVSYHIELYILGRINVSLKCSRLPVFIAVIDLQQYLTEQVICFNFQSMFDWMSLDRLKKIPGIHVYGDPLMSVVGFGPAEGFKYNIFTFSDMIAKRGWNLNPLQFPSRLVFLFCLLIELHVKIIFSYMYLRFFLSWTFEKKLSYFKCFT